MKVGYSYLQEQFSNIDDYLGDIKELVQTGDFTLGKAVTEFEERFAEMTGLPYAIGVGSGTDALILPLEILGIGKGDEVITAANTFIASAGAIAMAGGTPVFVDNKEDYTIDPEKIEAVITAKTKAILPVHLSGCPADMPRIMEIAKKHNLVVVEDAAQAILASVDGKHVGSWGETAGFSLHPLKNLNVWGDGGMIITRKKEHYDKLRLYRNHGMKSRDEYAFFGHNSRLDSLHAVIGNRLIKDVHPITDQRIANAARFDEAFKEMSDYITPPRREEGKKLVYHTYVFQACDRDPLLKFLLEKKISAKIHYPIPLPLQECCADLGYKKGDFPVCESHCESIITLPVHQHLKGEQIEYMIDCVKEFYLGAKVGTGGDLEVK